jgi:selT/selW/selH-like putative selenoprotein
MCIAFDPRSQFPCSKHLRQSPRDAMRAARAALTWASLRIHFCESCGYARHAQRLRQQLQSAGDLSDVRVEADGSGPVGSFEVSIARAPDQPREERLLWSKLSYGEPKVESSWPALDAYIVNELQALRRSEAIKSVEAVDAVDYSHAVRAVAAPRESVVQLPGTSLHFAGHQAARAMDSHRVCPARRF